MQLLAIFIFIFVLAGCTTTLTDMERANIACANNDGVSHLHPKYNSTVRAICNNGAKFTLKAGEATQ